MDPGPREIASVRDSEVVCQLSPRQINRTFSKTILETIFGLVLERTAQSEFLAKNEDPFKLFVCFTADHQTFLQFI